MTGLERGMVWRLGHGLRLCTGILWRLPGYDMRVWAAVLNILLETG
jgi:hypothetical protein